MPSLSWYLRRLATMSPREVAWRAGDAGRDLVDRWRFAAGRYPRLDSLDGWAASGTPPFRVSDVRPGSWRDATASPVAAWRDALTARADDLAANRLTFFNLTSRHAGDPIRWNQDLETGKPTPMSFAPGIDYRDVVTAGDAKVVWEPSRHQHLVVLGRAYRATGDERYARTLVAQLVSWLDQSPFGYGMNWRSPLEFGIRAINWVWALDLIRESAAWAEAPRDRIMHALYLLAWETERKYSRGSSSNNHLIGEAAGVFFVTAYCPHFPNAAAWHERSRAILAEELQRQTHDDGGTQEQATGYHLFTLQFYLACGIAARRLGRDFPPEYWNRLASMFEFVVALVEGGPYPMIGDADDGYVLDLGSGRVDLAGMLGVGAALFPRPDFARQATEPTEWATWLLGAALPQPASASASAKRLESRAFRATGYYLLQSGEAGTTDAISVIMDCAELGFGALAAHGHADALSVVLRVGGEDVLVDPGTYDYFTYPAWREYYRSTPAHNTVTVDGVDQSVMSGPFMWATRADASCVEWRPTPGGGAVVGQHEGYRRLSDPVVHRRRVELDGPSRRMIVSDEIVANGEHDVAIWFHFGERCQVQVDGQAVTVSVANERITLRFDPVLRLESIPARDAVGPGWVSRGYHRRTPAPSVVARTRTIGSATLTTTAIFG